MSSSDLVSQHVFLLLRHVFNVLAAVLSIIGIIAQAEGVLCESGSWSFRTAKAYISLFDAISIS